MKRLRIVGFVLVIVAVGSLWWLSREDAAHTFTLPDGNHLYFRGVTVGSNAPMDFGSPLEKLLRHLPKKLGGKQRRHVFRHKSEQETLVFWFEFERMPAPNSPVAVEFQDVNQRREFQAGPLPPVHTLGNGRIVTFCSFHDWPRWDKTLAVRIGQSDESKADGALVNFVKVGELSVGNPDHK